MPTHDGDTVGDAPALESAIPALARLENMMAAVNSRGIALFPDVFSELQKLEARLEAGRLEQLAGLDKVVVDEQLKELEELADADLTGFDALDLVGRARLGSGRALWGSEEFHSNVLAWLLAPKETHGLGERFLRSFLEHVGVLSSEAPGDWSGTEVIREWEHEVAGRRGFLDILVVNDSAEILCAIENKVFSSEHSEQLTRYRTALERGYPTFARTLVFLTPWATRPLLEEEQGYWKSLSYSVVFDIIQRMTESDDDGTDAGVRSFLGQYATTLRRNLMPETSIAQMARRIYLEHREAMDQIIDNKPDWVTEAKQWLKEDIELQEGWLLDAESPAFVRFRSADWDQFGVMQTGRGWAAQSSSALLLFEFTFNDGLPWLRLSLSPGDAANHDFRTKLFEKVRQNPSLFRPRTTSLPDGWAIIHDEDGYILEEVDYGIGWDDGTTRAKLDEWVANFAANYFSRMNEIIVNCLREHQDET